MKTEHAGAKTGGGFWGRRAEAKARSRSARRRAEPRIIAEELDQGVDYEWAFDDYFPDDFCAFCETCKGPCEGV